MERPNFDSVADGRGDRPESPDLPEQIGLPDRPDLPERPGRHVDLSNEPTRGTASANESRLSSGKPSAAKTGAPFIGIRFNCCRQYARIHRNGPATAYVGHCPRCGRRIEIPIGTGGTSSRFFEAD